MRTAILALAVLGLVAGCGGEAPAPAASAGPSIDPAVERVVEDWPLPAMLPGSALPDLVSVDGGKLLLSWTNSQRGRRHILQFSSYDVAGQRWETAPATIAVGNSMFVNWADTPHIMATRDGALWAHWLQKNGDAPYAYDVMLATSRDGGRRWSEPVSPHDDGTQTEHGFVSLWPRADGGLGIAWLDGRNTAARGDGHGEHAGAMTLRASGIDGALRRSADVEIDARVCDCCQTSAAVTARGPLLVYRGRSEGEIRDILATRLDGEAWTAPKPVHADGWEMPACPVNGPSVAAEGETAVVGWYTAAGGEPEVRIAASSDAGDSFAAPVVVDAGEAVHGRVAVALADGQAWVLWLREDADGQSIWLSRRSPDLATEHQRLQVAALAGRGRGTGFPQLAVAAGIAHVVWTDVDNGVAGLRGARLVTR
ncbi:sialidase family protein [Luteimonas arsenica]|uniref:sialidase family protein n=1 Tax=Luteimonas arsenica TaxID=1586242 RepID=UPI001054311D|nr:sialidase family protein [Luteimonas arsenica]